MNEYSPSKEEIGQAESLMSDEQRKASAIRAKNWEQDQPLWDDFSVHLNKNFERKPPSEQDIKRMDKNLVELGAVFAGSGIDWHLDGALNISLMKGSYIGNHKDIDISVEATQVPALEAQLLKNGFGLFLSRQKVGEENKVLRRVGAADFFDSAESHPLIAAIDEQGRLSHDKTLDSMDIHFVNRNKAGQPLGIAGTVIPEKWVTPQLVKFHDTQINLSHPAKVLYYKLNQGREYDATDIRRLVETGKITAADLDDIQQVLEEEYDVRLEKGRAIFEKIASELKPAMNAEEIMAVILNQPVIKKSNLKDQRPWAELAEKIYASPDRSPAALMDIVTEVFGISKGNDLKLKEIQKIRDLLTK